MDNSDIFGFGILVAGVACIFALIHEIIKSLSIVLAQLSVYAGIALLLIVSCYALKSASKTYSQAKKEHLKLRAIEYQLIIDIANNKPISAYERLLQLEDAEVKPVKPKRLTLASPELNQEPKYDYEV